MSAYTQWTRRALVRNDYSEEATYRAVLGNAEQLHPFATDGSLDAPDWIPTGAHSNHARGNSRSREEICA